MEMDVGRATERLMGMDDAAWERHANPWSGWTRVSILPLLALAIWSRVWLGWWSLAPVAVLIVWTWLNPRVFPPPRSVNNWMSQGVLGERIWLARNADPIPPHHQRMAVILSVASGFGVALLIWGLVLLDPGLTVAGLVLSMGGKLWFLDRMVWLKADTETG